MYKITEAQFNCNNYVAFSCGYGQIKELLKIFANISTNGGILKTTGLSNNVKLSYKFIVTTIKHSSSPDSFPKIFTTSTIITMFKTDGNRLQQIIDFLS